MAKILIVDDERGFRFLLRHHLEVAGHEISEARDGAVALELVEKLQPDLIVTDLMMPVMNGRELIARLKNDARTAGIPILQLSSNPDPDAGADATLDKFSPISEAIAISESLIEGKVDGGATIDGHS